MAHIQKRDDGKYRARFRGPDGKERSKTFDKKGDAQRFLDQKGVEKAKGLWVDPRAGRLPLREWAVECQDRRIDLRASSRARDETYIRLHILPRFGDVPLSKIDRGSVQRWVRDLETTHAPATVRECHRLLSGMLAEAVEEGLIGQSPCRKIRLPRLNRSTQRFLNAAEVERLADAVGPYYAPLILSAAYLGMRWGELAGLKRDALHLLKRQVTVRATLEEVKGHLRYVEEVKTKAGRRTLSIPPFLVDVLARHLSTAPESDFVFTSPDGAMLRRAFSRRYLKPALVRAGLDPSTRFHDLRHTCASLMIEAGAHAKEVQERLGHASIVTTMDTYGHLMPGLGAKLADALEATRGNVLDSQLAGSVARLR